MNQALDRLERLKRREDQAWQDVCAALLETNAVTRADVETSISVAVSPGQRLITKIWAWGELKAAVAERYAAEESE
jgi:hypothetical protein